MKQNQSEELKNKAKSLGGDLERRVRENLKIVVTYFKNIIYLLHKERRSKQKGANVQSDKGRKKEILKTNKLRR